MAKISCSDNLRKSAKDLGIGLTDKRIKDYSAAITRHMKYMARDDMAAYNSMTPAQRQGEAARRAANELHAGAIKAKKDKIANLALRESLLNQIKEGASVEQTAIFKDGLETHTGVVMRMIVSNTDLTGRTLSLEAARDGYQRIMRAELSTLFDIGGHGSLTNLLGARDGQTHLINELNGKDSGNPLARQAAQEFVKYADKWNAYLVALGADRRILKDWRHPQPSSVAKMIEAGKAKWIADTMPLLDKSQYIDPYDGSMLFDKPGAMERFLSEAYDGKLNYKKEVGGVSTGQRIGDTKERQLFFDKSDGGAQWLKYNEMYGNGTVLETIESHVRFMASTVAMMEKFGNNPRAMVKSLLEHSAVLDGERGVLPDVSRGVATDVDRAMNIYEHKTDPIHRLWLYNTVNRINSLFTAGLQGSTVVAQMADYGTMRANSLMLGSSAMKDAAYTLKMYNPANKEHRAELGRLGLFARGRAALALYLDPSSRLGFSQKAGQAVLDLSGASIKTELDRGTMSLVVADKLSELVGKHETLADFLKSEDNKYGVLGTYGITETDWQLWKISERATVFGDGEQLINPTNVGNIALDDAMPFVQDQIDRINNETQATIMKLDDASMVDNQRLQKRLFALQGLKDKLNKQIDSYKATREKDIGEYQKVLDAREMELMAKLNVAESDIELARAEVKEVTAKGKADLMRGFESALSGAISDAASIYQKQGVSVARVKSKLSAADREIRDKIGKLQDIDDAESSLLGKYSKLKQEIAEEISIAENKAAKAEAEGLTEKANDIHEWLIGFVEQSDAKLDSLMLKIENTTNRQDIQRAAVKMGITDIDNLVVQMKQDIEETKTVTAIQAARIGIARLKQAGKHVDDFAGTKVETTFDADGNITQTTKDGLVLRQQDKTFRLGLAIGQKRTMFIKQAQERARLLRAMESKANIEINDKAKGMIKRLEKMEASIDEYAKGMNKRTEKRDALIANYESSVHQKHQDAATKAIYDAQVRLSSIIHAESETGVINPGIAAKMALQRDRLRPGTVPWAISELGMKFISYPMAYSNRLLRRSLSVDGKFNKTRLAAHAASQAIFWGAMVVMIRDILNGKDPMPISDDDDPKKMLAFVAKAGVTGGVGGILGSFMFEGDNGIAGMAGPGIGSIGQLGKAAYGAFDHAIDPESTEKPMFNLIKVGKSLTPFQNFWATKLLTDRYIADEALEWANPGYNERKTDRAEREGHEYYWKPGQASPSRSPTFDEVFQ